MACWLAGWPLLVGWEIYELPQFFFWNIHNLHLQLGKPVGGALTLDQYGWRCRFPKAGFTMTWEHHLLLVNQGHFMCGGPFFHQVWIFQFGRQSWTPTACHFFWNKKPTSLVIQAVTFLGWWKRGLLRGCLWPPTIGDKKVTAFSPPGLHHFPKCFLKRTQASKTIFFAHRLFMLRKTHQINPWSK